MNLSIPIKLAAVGGALISISGLVNALLGLQIGAMYYEVYPGGKMGHVGVIAGAAAVLIGTIIMTVIVPMFRRRNRLLIAVGGMLTIVLGHIGAIAGALYIGTAGVILCYIAGLWIIVTVVVASLRRRA
jgi:hypothetical protein